MTCVFLLSQVLIFEIVWAILLLISVVLMAEGVVLITQLVDDATESGAFNATVAAVVSTGKTGSVAISNWFIQRRSTEVRFEYLFGMTLTCHRNSTSVFFSERSPQSFATQKNESPLFSAGQISR